MMRWSRNNTTTNPNASIANNIALIPVCHVLPQALAPSSQPYVRPAAMACTLSTEYPDLQIVMWVSARGLLTRVCVMRLYCDRCLNPFTEADCWPDVTPPGEDWSELCPSCRERKLKFYLKRKQKLTARWIVPTSGRRRPPDSTGTLIRSPNPTRLGKRAGRASLGVPIGLLGEPMSVTLAFGHAAHHPVRFVVGLGEVCSIASILNQRLELPLRG